ncbi:pentapeptide repeat-containing protein [Pantoea allii]|uniref:pentapeptide repeat-containing protein n=1 Tax=Pantoea allii TaxID=574096 RepID=UPI0024B80FD7|nr:pentapeptide repeat-containing protein [Pantoea allii]MDJ0087672.1 pentapeptide repeat-containing protein [Pantoea allii]
MNATELHKVLEEHKLWVTSMREHGSRANLRGANLYGADLYGADLRDANLRGADLYGADLRDANLRGANLCGADLRDANLRGANLCGANLCGADLPDHTFVIMGGVYYLQITNGEYVKAGCQNHTAEQWRKFTKREIAEMDGRKALKFYPRLLDVIDFYLGKGERPDWLNEPDSEEE